jgi:hypothetical protein
MNARPNIIDNVRNGLVLCMIGQFDKVESARLARAAKAGLIHKARAPFAGRYGAMKTYYSASADSFQRYQSKQIKRFDTAQVMDDFNRNFVA